MDGVMRADRAVHAAVRAAGLGERTEDATGWRLAVEIGGGGRGGEGGVDGEVCGGAIQVARRAIFPISLSFSPSLFLSQNRVWS